MSVTAPPRPPRSSDPVDRDELEALVEALIEEARRRARLRRRRYGACILLAALAAGGVYFGFDHTGGGAIGSRSAEAGQSGGATSSASLADGRWGPSRGPYGGPAYVVAVAPSAPSIVYLGTATGVFVSRNAGRSWHPAGLAVRHGALRVPELRITSLAVDPRTPRTVYAVRTRWVDGGVTFRQELHKSTDGGRSWHALGLAAPQDVAVSPADPTTVFAIAAGSSRATNRLLRSTDGGRSWQAADRGLGATRFSGIAFDPTSSTTVYAATDRGILRSGDGGSGWSPASGGLARQPASAVMVDPRHPQTVYAGTDGGVIGSQDGGRSWRLLNRAMGGHGRDRDYGEVLSLAVDPFDSQKLYATVGCIGVFESSDGGRRWRAANAGRVSGCLDAFLALDPRTPRTIYAVYPGRGVFKSTDGAARWHPASTGLDLTTISSLAIDPHHAHIVFAGAGPQGLFRSSDGGAHWLPVARGLKNVTAVALDPHHPATVLAASRPSHRIARSADGGRTWQPAGSGMTANVLALALAGDRAYAGTASRGVFRSRDGRRSWQGISGPGNEYVQALAISPGDPDLVYAGNLGSNARGLYRSADGGQTWQRLTETLRDPDVSAVALDPTSPASIYIGTAGEGVFKSTDGGAGWQPASTGLPRITLKGTTAAGKVTSWTGTVGITALAVDPARPATLYTATSGSGIFRSTDAGRTWRPFNAGLDVFDVASLAIDATGRTLYAGTVRGGVVALHVGTG